MRTRRGVVTIGAAAGMAILLVGMAWTKGAEADRGNGRGGGRDTERLNPYLETCIDPGEIRVFHTAEEVEWIIRWSEDFCVETGDNPCVARFVDGSRAIWDKFYRPCPMTGNNSNWPCIPNFHDQLPDWLWYPTPYDSPYGDRWRYPRINPYYKHPWIECAGTLSLSQDCQHIYKIEFDDDGNILSYPKEHEFIVVPLHAIRSWQQMRDRETTCVRTQ